MRNQPFLVLLAIGLMIGGCGDASEAEREAERLVDDFYEALESVDADAAAASFTQDGVFVDKQNNERVGRSEIASHFETYGPDITRCRRTGAATSAGDESFVFPMEFTHGLDYVAEVVLTLEDGLIVRHDWNTIPRSASP